MKFTFRRLVTVTTFAVALLFWATLRDNPFDSVPFKAADLHPQFTCNPELTQCVYYDLCINSEYGIFYISDDPSFKLPPVLGPATAFTPWHYNITPFVVHPDDLHVKTVGYLRNTVLVVAGSFAPFHLSLDIHGSFVPVEALLNRFDLPGIPPQELHLLTVGKFPTNPEATHKFPIACLGFSRLFGSGVKKGGSAEYFTRYPIFDGLDAKNKEVLQGHTLCYPKTIVGLGDVCSRCSNKPTLKDYRTLRSKVLRHFNVPDGPIEGRFLLLRRMGRRQVVNHDEVVEYLKGLGVDLRVIVPEELTMQEQVAAFAEASVFIAPHGNGNVHIHWMHEKGLFVEAFTWTGFGYPSFSSAAINRGMRYRDLNCTSALCEQLATGEEIKHNLHINITALDQILREEGVIPTPAKGDR